MKRLTYSIPLSLMAVLLFVSVAIAQSSPDQSIPDPYGTGQDIPDHGIPDQGSPNQGAETANTIQTSVSIESFGFYRAHINVDPGTPVEWINVDTRSHTVTSDDGAFDSGEMKPGQTFTFTFDESGKWRYHSELDSNMTGSVIVGEYSRGGESTAPAESASDPTQKPDSTQTTDGTAQMPSAA
jgi:plastocyanin